MLDTGIRVEIPGGIELDAQVVGPIPRFLAFFIDLIIRALILGLASLAAIPLGLAGGGFFLIALFVIEWFYPVLFEVFWHGQTPGKRRLGISVINDDLTPISFGPSMVRNLLRTVDFLPFFYLVGLVSMVSNSRFQRLGDLAAATIVISVKESAKPSLVENIQPLAPPIVLSRNEKISIIEFLQRRQALSISRQQELAKILEGVTHQQNQDGVTILHRIGAWFLGVK